MGNTFSDCIGTTAGGQDSATLQEDEIPYPEDDTKQQTVLLYRGLDLALAGNASFDHLLQNSQRFDYHSWLKPASSTSPSDISVEELKQKDYRAFAMLVHQKYGLLMLHCTRKKKKPPHHQLPGGHVDDIELEQYKKPKSSSPREHLYLAARAACAREVWEETGIDFRSNLDRLSPAAMWDPEEQNKLVNEYKHRLFFVAKLTDDDFYKRTSENLDKLTCPERVDDDVNVDEHQELLLKLSVEHSGFRFQSNPHEALQLLQWHSGGKVSEALKYSLEANLTPMDTSTPRSEVVTYAKLEHLLQNSQQYAQYHVSLASMSTSASLESLKPKDYRGFVFLIHEKHGLILLHCTRKKNKPPHHQLPGGHVDDFELVKYAAPNSSTPQEQLYLAARAGCAREVWEETGVDMRSSLHRLLPAVLRSSEENPDKLINEYKHRLFFAAKVTDDDFRKRTPENATERLARPESIGPNDDESQRELLLKLSVEHSGFRFQSNAQEAIELLEHHSGGKVSESLKCALKTTLPYPAFQDEYDGPEDEVRARALERESESKDHATTQLPRAEEEARLKAESEPQRLEAEKDAQQFAEAESRLQAEQEEQRQKGEAELRKRGEEEARFQAERVHEHEQAEAESRRRAEEEARLQADQEEARQGEEEAARKRAEEEATGKMADEDSKRKAEEKASKGIEEEVMTRTEEEVEQKEEETEERPMDETTLKEEDVSKTNNEEGSQIGAGREEAEIGTEVGEGKKDEKDGQSDAEADRQEAEEEAPEKVKQNMVIEAEEKPVEETMKSVDAVAKMNNEEDSQVGSEEATGEKAEEETNVEAEVGDRGNDQEEAQSEAAEADRLEAEEAAVGSVGGEAKQQQEEQTEENRTAETTMKEDGVAKTNTEEDSQVGAEEVTGEKAEEETNVEAEVGEGGNDQEEAQSEAEEADRQEAEEEAGGSVGGEANQQEEQTEENQTAETTMKEDGVAKTNTEEDCQIGADEAAGKNAEEDAEIEADVDEGEKDHEETQSEAEEDDGQEAEEEALGESNEEVRQSKEDETEEKPTSADELAKANTKEDTQVGAEEAAGKNAEEAAEHKKAEDAETNNLARVKGSGGSDGREEDVEQCPEEVPASDEVVAPEVETSSRAEDTNATDEVATDERPNKKKLDASYAQIAEEKRKVMEQDKQNVETAMVKAQDKIEAERLQSIEKLEEERKRVKLEEERKAAEHVRSIEASSSAKTICKESPAQGSKSLVLLVSKASGSLSQKSNQDRALTMLESNEFDITVVDGSDPNVKTRRDYLFGISQLRGSYPQLFLVNAEDDVTTFLGDFEVIERMNDSGTLTRQSLFGEGSPNITVGIDGGGMKEQRTADKDKVDLTSATMDNDRSLIMLVSKASGNLAQKANQERALRMLFSHKVRPELVDGSDPANKEIRDRLFDLSGVLGNYPQFFLKVGADYTFVGDIDAIEAMNDSGPLEELFG